MNKEYNKKAMYDIRSVIQYRYKKYYLKAIMISLMNVDYAVVKS